MKPAVHNLDIYRGDSYELFVRIREKVWSAATNSYIPGSYVTLTGFTGKAQIRPDADSSTVSAEMGVTLANQTTTPGGVFVRLTAAQATALTITNGVWDLQITDGSGNVNTYLKGSVTVDKDVTKS